MATYLVVEDGTGLANANSYVTVDEFLTYIDERGLTISASSDHDYIENLLIKAADFIESKKSLFKGDKASSTQALAWPRDRVYIDGFAVASTSLPRELTYAQMQLAYDADTTDLQPVIAQQDKGDIAKEKVGEIERVYHNSGKRRSTPAFTKADSLLRVLYKNSGLFAVRS